MKQARLVYPMAQLRNKLTEEQIAKYSERYDFSENDKYFHYDEDAELLESLNDEDINFFNKSVEPNEMLMILAA